MFNTRPITTVAAVVALTRIMRQPKMDIFALCRYLLPTYTCKFHIYTERERKRERERERRERGREEGKREEGKRRKEGVERERDRKDRRKRGNELYICSLNSQRAHFSDC